jgi:hypothetical protein
VVSKAVAPVHDDEELQPSPKRSRLQKTAAVRQPHVLDDAEEPMEASRGRVERKGGGLARAAPAKVEVKVEKPLNDGDDDDVAFTKRVIKAEVAADAAAAAEVVGGGSGGDVEALCPVCSSLLTSYIPFVF